jgi:NAD(P)H-dependent flavin oxidoreductase YrpB (nitropropane dioxygenase family)
VNIRTPLCDLLGIDVPILSVGFASSATPELAAAVSNAGGLGVLGLGLPLDVLRDRVARTRALTARPFGGNFILAAFADPETPEKYREARRSQIATATDERVPVLVLFWGDPSPFVEPAHRAGLKVLVQVGSVGESNAAIKAGVDGVILQGVEAGGHVKATRSIWETLPAAVAAAHGVPIIASGGIGDGRAIARAMRLGAQGVSLGTRFVASEEAWIHPHYKRRIVDAGSDDTVFSPDLFNVGWDNAPHRALKNKTYEMWDAAGRPPIGKRPGEGEIVGTFHLPWGDQKSERYESAMLIPAFDGDPEDVVMWAGLSVDTVNDVKPAADIVRDLVRETEVALAS